MVKKSTGNSRGQGIVEFTLVLPFLLVLVGGATDWGLGFFVSHVVQNAAREGARIAVTFPELEVGPPPGPKYNPPAGYTKIRDAVRSRIPDINLFSSFRGDTQISIIPPDPSAPACTQEVTVQVSGTYSFSFLALLGFDTMQISRGTTMRYELQQPCV